MNRTFTALVICEKGHEEEGAGEGGEGDSRETLPHLFNTALFIPDGGSSALDAVFVCLQMIYLCSLLSFFSFSSLGPCSHTVQKLKLEDISAITVKTLKVIPDRIIDNYNKRQQLRFKWVTSSSKRPSVHFLYLP